MPPHLFAILGVLRLGARTGYDVRRVIDQSARFFFTISPAQIYPGLARLEEEGLVVGSASPRGGRQRREFVVTPAGEEAFVRWLHDDGATPFELRDLAVLKLFFADAVEPGQARELIGAIRRRSAETLRELRRDVEPAAQALADAGGVDYPAVALRIGIAVHEAVIAECDALLAETG